MTRDELAHLAQDVATGVYSIRSNTTFRVVVVVTDVDGEFVGVGSNTSHDDVLALLVSATVAMDRVDYPVGVRTVVKRERSR
jgi:hypothetical protein